jgi:excisionase family DNA binding protein
VVSEYLTPRQVAEVLSVDRLTVYRMIHDGRLAASRVGKRGLRVSREAVAAVLRPVKP